MEASRSNSVFILKLIGSLFTLITVVLSVTVVWLFIQKHEMEPSADFQGFLLATVILNAATATIAAFIWWIISNRKKFLP
jgi:hypothetical protein